ncbi:ATP-binding protein [Hydrogenophaga sp. 5NK40-0174]|uniref:sensor histidine kinase n=1 Tax=Hydrogenophaga sp. 5NK40-0174 TaxID=3127649 RepID=UPI003108D2EE
MSTKRSPSQRPPLLSDVPAETPATGGGLEGMDENAWLDVIHKMDEVYSQLIDDEIELEKKNAQLEQSQQFIVSVLSSMSDVLLVCDDSGQIEQANAALCELLGQDEAHLRTQRLQDILTDGDSIDRAEAALQGAGNSGDRSSESIELNLLGPDGQPVPVDASCTPRLGSNGKRLGTVWVGRPMGEIKRAYRELQTAHDALKRTQQQLLHSEKMASLGQLTAGVAHELNNPISFVLGNVHALRRYCDRLQTYMGALAGQAPDQEIAHLKGKLRIDHLMADLPSLIDGTLEGAQRTADIVHGLKRFSAMDAEEHDAVALASVVERSIHWVQKGRTHGVQVHWEPDQACTTRGNAGQLQQVMMNLLQNAFDAVTANNEKNRHVWVTMHCDGKHVAVKVRDNGPGIPAEHLMRLFDPFFTTKPVGKGTGLGLSISYGIAEQHGGTLSAQNVKDPLGAEFTLTLPVFPAA